MRSNGYTGQLSRSNYHTESLLHPHGLPRSCWRITDNTIHKHDAAAKFFNSSSSFNEAISCISWFAVWPAQPRTNLARSTPLSSCIQSKWTVVVVDTRTDVAMNHGSSDERAMRVGSYHPRVGDQNRSSCPVRSAEAEWMVFPHPATAGLAVRISMPRSMDRPRLIKASRDQSSKANSIVLNSIERIKCI